MSGVDEELRLSEEALEDYSKMENTSLRRRYSTLYYALYHAVNASLVHLDYTAKTHSGTDSLVRNILFKDKQILDREEAQVFSKLKTRREQADYDTEFYGSGEELDEFEETAKAAIDKIREHLKD